MSDPTTYATQSAVTDPGGLADRLDEVPSDLRSLQQAACRLVFHYRAGGDYAENGIAAERIAEIDTRYADRMFRRIFELSDAPLTEDRPPYQRLVGCCRDSAVFFLALARHKAIPVRARVGFATYFRPGWYVDHEVAEVWDPDERRWRLVDPGLGEGHVDQADGMVIDPLDVPADRFIVAPGAWLACRDGDADPERFVVAPDLEEPQTRGWPQLVNNLIHDLAALNKREMVLWDVWGLIESSDAGELTADQLELLDRLAKVTSSDDPAPEELRGLYDRDEFRVPPVVTSYSAAASEPLRVRLER